MVVALGPGKFYGSSLPRPRIYTDVKLNESRIDPPTAVMDPLLSWANEAHWSMGGLSFTRHRLQGRIEGSIKKLRAQCERGEREARKATPSKSEKGPEKKIRKLDLIDWEDMGSESEPEGEKGEEAEGVKVEIVLPSSKKRARKLVDEFEKVAAEKENKKEKKAKGVADRISNRTRSRRSDTEEPGKVRRTSPRKSAA